MKNCPPEEKLSAYFDGEVPAVELAAIEAHLGLCKACSDEVAAFRELDRLAGAAAAPAVAAEEWDAAWCAIESRVEAAQRRAHARVWHRRVAWVAAAAACLALAIGTGIVLPSRPTAKAPPPPVERMVVEECAIETGPGYNAMVSYSPEGDVMITVSAAAAEEAPSDGPSGKVL